eukprot:3890436-Pyramimonas_sp.AAC.1
MLESGAGETGAGAASRLRSRSATRLARPRPEQTMALLVASWSHFSSHWSAMIVTLENGPPATTLADP